MLPDAIFLQSLRVRKLIQLDLLISPVISPNMSKIRFGFVGAGAIAVSSAHSVNSHQNGTVVAIQDINCERATELGRTLNIPKVYATAEELFADSEIDAVYIAVPNKFHVDLTIKALEAGKHVVLEKPFAMSYEEALCAVEVAKRVGKVLTLGMNVRFMSSIQKTKALVEQGALGEVYHAKAYWFRRAGIPRLGTWFGNRELSGGGCLNDIGVHVLDSCLHLLGNFDPVSVSGATYSKFGPRGLGEGGWGKSDREGLVFNVDDFATGLIRFANGATISLDVSWAGHAQEGNRNDIELYGTEAGARAFSNTFYKSTPEGYQVTQDPAVEIRYKHADRFHNFINHLQGEEELCVTAEQAAKVQRILDALNESAATGREVRFDG